ncbi:hypothetical protein ANN_11230 [Periplaneta americana]|uniref:Uncharacterized protein n=1 Tax=Periplaneta americana TaxID=6978 RepID=A0ABQ8T6Q1_PERAM|nr:hypothetical protein ANN_11230 [Periplaneta americana]
MAGLFESGNEPPGSLKEKMFQGSELIMEKNVSLKQLHKKKSELQTSRVDSFVKICVVYFILLPSKVRPELSLGFKKRIYSIVSELLLSSVDNIHMLHVDIDEEFNETLYSISDSDNKIDIRIFNYVLNHTRTTRKNKIARSTVNLLMKHTGLETNVRMSKQNGADFNVDFCANNNEVDDLKTLFDSYGVRLTLCQPTRPGLNNSRVMDYEEFQHNSTILKAYGTADTFVSE